MSMKRRPNPVRSGYATWAPIDTPRSAAAAHTRRMIDGSPAWKPQATLALETMSSSALSSPIFHGPSPSPRSLLMSIDRHGRRQERCVRDFGVAQALEAAPAVRPGQDRDLEVVGHERSVRTGERVDAGADRGSQVEALLPGLVEAAGDRLGVAAEHAEASFVHHGAVVEDVEQLIAGAVVGHLGDEDLDLHRLHLVGEDLPEHLRVAVGQAARVDIVAAVLVALEIGGAHAGDAELIELVVLADAGEGDPVVDLADLAQGVRRVLGNERDAVAVAQAPPSLGLWRCPCARSRRGPSSPVPARRRTACSRVGPRRRRRSPRSARPVRRR